ncbi:hypothetical protein O6H91_02G117000 [Diphasiastrum complanatum]|uniref:Uncharacterized protein n=1 Tax=Diphasiastrum complanatum TaxID=34168 RepID=A0ACC2EJW0_DIPCM|nr:hypothetical protein O6H91_02G117000 [Diphasiastrum complanatum]
MEEASVQQDEERNGAEEGWGWGCGGGGGGSRVVLKKGPWTAAEDAILVTYVHKHGEGNWNSLQKHSGLSRCGKSCRLRWANHLRPNLKKGAFTVDEERLIIELHAKLGNKWARMAAQLPGRTDNEIKNYWNTRIKRRQRAGLPVYPPEVQSIHISSSCVQIQGDSTSVSTNTDSDSDALPSPSIEMPSLNLAMDGFSVPVAFPKIPLDPVSNHALTVPASSVSKFLQDFKSPSNSHCYFTEYKAMSFSQLSDTMTKCFESSHRQPHCTGALDSMLAQGFPLEPDPGIGGQFPGVQPNYHGFASGSYSFFGLDSSLKLELPSAQCVNAAGSAGTDASALTSTLTPLSSSKSMLSESHSFEHVSSSGLLESLLQEAEAKQRISHFISQKDLSSVHTLDDDTFVNKTLWIEDSDAVVSLGTVGNCAVNDAIEPISSSYVFNWKDAPSSLSIPNFIRPYEVVVSKWYNSQAPDNAVETCRHPVVADPENGAISSSSALNSGYPGLEPAVTGHIWELGFSQWNNMPGACLIGDFPADCRAFITAADQSVDACAIF